MRGVRGDDIVANSTDGFAVRTSEEFLAFLRAAVASEAGRPEAPGAFLVAYPNLNNRAENSHQPTPRPERRQQRFNSPGHAQRFLSAYGPIVSHFRPRHHRLSGPAYHQEM